MRWALVVLLAGCASVRPTATPLPDDDVVQRSHELMVAYDHGDVITLDAMLTAGFVHVDGSQQSSRKDDLAIPPDAEFPIVGKRTWSEESVHGSSDVRIFRGLADEEEAGNEVHGNYRHRGWYTMVWVREGGAWKVAMLTWQRAGHEAEDHWDSVYRNQVGFEHEPNKLLVAAVAGVKPGAALDVATGQGRNGLYLARQGWTVVGVDYSVEGLRQAREVATAEKLAYEPIYADLNTYDFGVARYDLVAVIYTPDHPEWLPRFQAALKPGGLFVLEFFARIPGTKGGTDLAELQAAFAGWDIQKAEVVDDTPDWARSKAKLVRFVARKP